MNEVIAINIGALLLMAPVAQIYKAYEFIAVVAMQIITYLVIYLSIPENPSNLVIDAYYLSVSLILLVTVYKVRGLKPKTFKQLLAKHCYNLAALVFTLINLLCIMLPIDVIYGLHDTFGSLFILLEVTACLAWSVGSR